MNRLFTVASLLILFSLTGWAQQPADTPASKEDVEKYFRVTRSRELLDKTMEAMAKPMHQLVHQQCEKDKEKLPPDCEAQLNKMIDDMWKHMPWDEMMQAMVPAYQKHFTKGDLDTLIAFYSSPTGQKVLRELPAITGEAMESMMPILRKQMGEMAQRVQEQTAEWAKASQKESSRPSPTRD